MDILRLAHAVATYSPDAINVPLNENGKQVFKLGLLAAANGLALDNAHDAHADTRATLELAICSTKGLHGDGRVIVVNHFRAFGQFLE